VPEPDPRQSAIDKQVLAAVTDSPLFVQACPGAGKTRMVVDRHVSKRPKAARARALTSFTNVATAEMRNRLLLRGRADLAEYPNFVGNIDQFLWLHLVRPYLPPSQQWRRLRSWDAIRATVSLGEAGSVPLSAFDFRHDFTSGRCVASLRYGGSIAATYRKLQQSGSLDWAGRRAVEDRDRHRVRGYVTGHEVRVRAIAHLLEHKSLARLLGVRFDELIVDEAQDCSEADLVILHLLQDGGLPLVLVGDPDQAIYEFRGSRPDAVLTFGSALANQLRLDSNWRSTPAICRLAWTLRPDRAERPPDVAVGPQAYNVTPAMLMPYSGQPALRMVIESFLGAASGAGIAAFDCLVLAHRGGALPKDIVSLGRSPVVTSSAAERLAWAKAVLSLASAATETREAAYAEAEAVLMRYWTGAETIDEAPMDTYTRLELSASDVRQAADKLVSGLPELPDLSGAEWCAQANRLLKSCPPRTGFVRRGTSGALRCPAANKSKPASALSRTVGLVVSPKARGSVIHQVKGTEVPAVLLIIPDDARTERLVEAWEAGASAEELRVIYVAITRAERLAAIALPQKFSRRLERLWSEFNVPFVVGGAD
jgi:DNA helicase-2/ATP-dependent DNA helicase PcrA